MKKLSLNIKKIALSLLVVGLAVGSQSFINAEKNKVGKAKRAGAIAADYLVQPVSGTFNQFPTGSPDPSACKSTSSRHCFYTVSTVGKDSIPNLASYTVAQIDLYVMKGWISSGAGSTINKRYVP